ncbi:N-acetyl-gamma-glutamyl-phosphate reductase, partial [Corynebacterium sp. 35RC1]|nr:N-acetyl-gamma-glutamyl-phosphate reductase [Corynebacterium sp. 35RC1]
PKLDSPRPYALALAHKHLPEMRVQSKLSLAPIFTPVVGNFLKGLAVTIGLHPQHLARKASPADIARVLADYYQGEQFIRVAPADNVATLDNGFFDVQGANDTNRADLFVFGSDERMVVTARLDNLGKGAAGAAVQCMNVHLGVDEA